jgi:predicted RNase H-like HicB family nuclease
MKPLRIPLRAVLYKEEGNWIAHCLEFDLIGDGETQKDAIRNLTEAIAIQIQASLKYRNPANLFKPAEGRYFRMFAAGANIAIGQMEFLPKTDNVTIEDVQAREYSDSDPDPMDSDADLALV